MKQENDRKNKEYADTAEGRLLSSVLFVGWMLSVVREHMASRMGALRAYVRRRH